MRTTVHIQNMKCEGCKNALRIKLNKVDGISNVEINIADSSVAFDYTTHNVIEGLRAELRDMGYPITGDPNSIVSKAKSYVSCALGKVSNVK
ncbi:heavy-metal-associated domain-containing protein [Winogradskyella jejuensis]|uniref:Copper chaperone CopZ n=1 Tax=Winogradskyella jejuensis TaxID=1089305 RepID=A0A1M5KPW6_9FLAO|nr:heavy-metal-associated domain-containing protein [Winogradskyella jejuensis]SHG54549.1 Copper chaperone CopZ [Winogradskyella jejuensis]